jgi:hypothetical protein
MRNFIAVFLLCFSGIVALGCGSSDSSSPSGQATICKTLQNCNLLAGTSESDCEENVEKGYTSSQIKDCADCANGKSCSTLENGDCSAACPNL